MMHRRGGLLRVRLGRLRLRGIQAARPVLCRNLIRVSLRHGVKFINLAAQHRDPRRRRLAHLEPARPQRRVPTKLTAIVGTRVRIRAVVPGRMGGNQPTLQVPEQPARDAFDDRPECFGRIDPPGLEDVIRSHLPVDDIAATRAERAERQLGRELELFPRGLITEGIAKGRQRVPGAVCSVHLTCAWRRGIVFWSEHKGPPRSGFWSVWDSVP